MKTSLNWSARGPVMLGLLSLMFLLCGFGLWAVQANIAGAIIAPGRLEVDQNRQVLQHPDGGVVSEIMVREGARVTRGDPLIRLDATRLRSEMKIVEGQLFELIARIDRLKAERDDHPHITTDPILSEAATTRPELQQLVDGQQRLFDTRMSSAAQSAAQLEKRKRQIANQIEGVRAQQAATRTQLDLLREELGTQQDLLAKGLAHGSRVLALLREDARLRGTLGELTASIAQNQGRVTEIELDILRLQTQRKEDVITQLRDLQYREFELREQRASLQERLSRLDITAPVSGLVFGLSVFAERAVISPAEALMFIVPQDRPFVITGEIEPLHIDEVFIGQDVSLRFATFDTGSTPEVFGTVSSISGDAFTDDRTARSFYRVEMTLKPGEMARLGDVVLLPGMPVDGFIQTSTRSPMAYLLKPLADYFNRAFRET